MTGDFPWDTAGLGVGPEVGDGRYDPNPEVSDNPYQFDEQPKQEGYGEALQELEAGTLF